MKKISSSIILGILFFLFPMIVNAGTAKFTYSGDTSVTEGKKVTLTVKLTPSEESYGNQGYITYDASYLKLVDSKKITSLSGSFDKSSKKFMFYNAEFNNPIKGTGSLFSVTFEALKSGSTTLGFKDTKVSLSKTNQAASVSNNSFKLSIKEPASTNNNLSSLTVSEGSINFSKGTTSYKVNVGASVTSIKVDASVEDSKASLTGTGTKSLSYGSNTIKVKVTAEDGSTKTYTINVVRADDRSSNNNLSSLTVSNRTLTPGFSKGTTSYSIEVPYSVSSLNLKYETEDSKAKVNVSGNSLVAEKTTTVTITVTAENGSKKSYTIKAKRGKDPNKKLSTNNNLVSLSPSVGMLSPVFDKDKVNYIIYLPYEVSKINFDAEVSDTEYATIEWNKPETLGIGENIIEAKVKAESGDIKTYKIIVVRAASLEDAKTDSNTDLKSLKVENGKLLTSFSNKVHYYTYKKGEEALKINAVATDVNATVNVLNSGDIYTVLVESASGDKSFYIFAPEQIKDNKLVYILCGVIAFLVLLIIIILILKRKKKKEKDHE